jgi:O-antigen chain-terminating methyltransferase
MKKTPDQSFDVITSFHLIEHLPFQEFLAVTGNAYRMIRPGGVLIYETPNPGNVLVATSSFYLDPTHRAPIPSKLSEFVLKYFKFSEVSILGLHSFPESFWIKDSVIAQRFSEYFYGSQDYAVIGRKPL